MRSFRVSNRVITTFNIVRIHNIHACVAIELCVFINHYIPGNNYMVANHEIKQTTLNTFVLGRDLDH
jgi:hypothetical protein